MRQIAYMDALRWAEASMGTKTANSVTSDGGQRWRKGGSSGWRTPEWRCLLRDRFCCVTVLNSIVVPFVESPGFRTVHKDGDTFIYHTLAIRLQLCTDCIFKSITTDYNNKWPIWPNVLFLKLYWKSVYYELCTCYCECECAERKHQVGLKGTRWAYSLLDKQRAGSITRWSGPNHITV